MKNYFTKSNYSSVTNSGQAMIIVAVFSLLLIVAILSGVVLPAFRGSRIALELLNSKQSFFLSEAALEDVAYRLKAGWTVVSPDTLTLNGQTATTTIIDDLDEKVATSRGEVNSAVRKVSARFNIGSGASFNFGVQSDVGGFIMENSSSVNGNLYSNGSVLGFNNSIVRGEVVSAGPAGLVDGIHATGTVYAKTIQNSTIEKDAYYQVLVNSSVSGNLYPGSAVQATTSLPVTDAKIEEWKNNAAAGGTIDCQSSKYEIKSVTTIGPVKINCDLEISGNNYTVTLAGPIWVTGDIIVKNGPILKVAPALGKKSVQLIADRPDDRLTSSKINLDNSAIYEGSGSPGSYIMMISQNNSAETGGSNKAINLANSGQGALLVYAGHGEIQIQNSTKLKQVTAWRIRLKNSATVEYETGLASVVFSTGPGGTWNVSGWGEIN